MVMSDPPWKRNVTVSLSEAGWAQLNQIGQTRGVALDAVATELLEQALVPQEISVPVEVEAPAPLPAAPAGVEECDSQLDCPRCATRLFGFRGEGWRLEGCTVCGGVWAANADAVSLLSRLPAAALDVAGRLSDGAVGVTRTDQAWPCPECRSPMRKAHARTTVAWVDLCEHHGTWFERYELQAVLHAAAEHRMQQLMARQQDSTERRKARELAQVLRSAALDAEIVQVKRLYQSAYAEGAGHRRR
jgi:Zn-finger nucleic acid-binding protein